MFFALNQYGTERLNRVFETLPIDSSKRLHDTAKFLDVSERTLSSWLTGKTDPPRAAPAPPRAANDPHPNAPPIKNAPNKRHASTPRHQMRVKLMAFFAIIFFATPNHAHKAQQANNCPRPTTSSPTNKKPTPAATPTHRPRKPRKQQHSKHKYFSKPPDVVQPAQKS